MLEGVAEFYRTVLQPTQPFTALAGVPISLLDIAATFRLCLVMRQIREQLLAAHLKKAAAASYGAANGNAVRVQEVERRSFVREASAVLLVVYAGEALTGACLPSSNPLAF